ncbi:hypothetical protein NQZ79_g434 [Umbelopsis isabellina]|nr:hypothetical protein NQZ79_g434 [Umbelopsis isabellina]
MQAGGFSSRTSSFRTSMSAFRETASRRQEDKRRNSQSGITMRDGHKKDDNNYGIPHTVDQQERVKAAFVVLVRNRELDDLRSSMSHMEATFNWKYNYPWIFLNEEPFTEEFINLTRSMTKAEVSYGLVPKEHWSYPDWINQTYAKQQRKEMARKGIIYGGSESYRHMCRRVEPDVKFMCDIDYDPFAYMKKHKKKYGFTISLREFRETVESLWSVTRVWMDANKELVVPSDHPGNLMKFISEDGGSTYNMCHFWSNFEIASVSFLRSEAYQSYFRHLDEAGGFFYERWGDAPVHSIAVSMLLTEPEVHFFHDMGYRHGPFEHCPETPNWLRDGKCYCDSRTNFDMSANSCLSHWLQVTNRTRDSYIISEKI